ncbi:hypothetical protein PS928_03231 [Pseudomonas fluorescens]|uniref:Uncharacterized protein n=1 Tax=Pseudomonas fluorescens TaxID=294 RepID=A0A5E7U9C9_PSEFL|nr:hypothetical protein PS928_03231 [Pseudomonas fluorescens]
MIDPSELKTIGLTPAIYCSDQAVFHVTRGVPLGDALGMASDFMFLAKARPKTLPTTGKAIVTPGLRVI